jgi:hypothetical protein
MPMTDEFRLAVVEEHLGSDSHPARYPDFAGEPPENHIPVDVCAFAACAAGTYHRKHQTVPAATSNVLLLLDKLGSCLRALTELQRAGKTVAITFAEAGTMQVADLLSAPEALRDFHEICRRADAAIATTPEGASVFRGAGGRNVELIPTPCPVDDPRWDFSVPPDQRRGILIGTFEFCTHYRNHVAALLSARRVAEATGEPVTLVRGGRRYNRRMAEQVERHWPAGLLRVIEGPLPALQFVRLMAGHKLVFQFDQAGAAGQVAGEALLCRIPCVGGYGGIERVVFPDLCGFGHTPEQLVGFATRLIEQPSEAEAAVARALSIATDQLSFAAARARLAELFARLGSQAGTIGSGARSAG